MKIVVCAKDAEERDVLSRGLRAHELVFADALEEVGQGDDVDCLCVFIKTTVRAPELDLFPNLRGIVTRSTGYDHIDVAEAKKRGIIVSNVPAYGENTIAEYAFAMLLALSRRICETDRQVRIDGYCGHRTHGGACDTYRARVWHGRDCL
jgi:D-lactate dehydrogenase